MLGLPFAAFHEDVDVIVGFGKVDELDYIGMLYFLANYHLRLDSLNDVHLQLLFRSLVTFLLRYLC